MTNTNAILENAFPKSLSKDIESLVVFYNLNSKNVSNGSFTIKYKNELLKIPDRIYLEPINLEKMSNISEIQKVILSCIYTRHHDGFIRGKNLKTIMKTKFDWTIPFVLKLLGEYVIEILQIIKSNLDEIDKDSYKKIIADNGQFYELTKQRVVSYWNEYYRKTYKNKKDYAGFQILEFLDNLIKV